MCNACFADDKIETKTTFTVELGNSLIVVRNVPCLECRVCGELIFSDEVSFRLEKIIDTVKTFVQDVSVIDFAKAA